MTPFTIIIPTHNRHSYLKRSIEYFRNLSVKVVYCDSSLSPFNYAVPGNVVYLHLPNLNFSDKVLHALEVINTPIIVLCADDDFILLSSLYKGSDILFNNSNIVAVHGNTIEFKKEFDGKFYTNRVFEEEIVLGTSEDRINKLFSDYRQLLWGMYRTVLLKHTFELIKRGNFKNDNFYEMVLGVVVGFNGDVKFLKDIWSIRENSHESHWATRHKALYYYKQDKEIQNDINTYIRIISEYARSGIGELALGRYLRMSVYMELVFLTKFYLQKWFPAWLVSVLRKKVIADSKFEIVDSNTYPDLIFLKELLLTDDKSS